MKNNSKSSLLKRLIICLGIIVGIIAIVFGIVILSSKSYRADRIINNVEFGGDYYTYSYAAQKKTVSNLEAVYDVLKILQNAFGYLLIICGLLFVVVFTFRLIKNIFPEATFINENGDCTLNNTQNELETLKRLFEVDAISQEEYENKKREILGL